MCKSLQAAGFLVQVASGQMSVSGHLAELHEGIEVFSLNERTAEHLPGFVKHLAYFNMGRKTVEWLDALAVKPAAVVLYSGYSPYLFHLLPWARRHGVQLVFDAVEWYDPASSFGWFSPYQLNIELAMRFLLPKVGHVISISDYLHRYYLEHGCSSLVVPPTLDVLGVTARFEQVRTQPRPLELVYAGSPGNKDLLNNILEAVLRMRQTGHDLHLSVAGVTREHANRYSAVQMRDAAEVVAAVSFLGVLSHSASMDLVRQADFSLLLRHDARYSRAGFPTKFVESLAVGTPVVANLTSDLHRYLKDGESGFVSAGPMPEDLISALMRALTLTPEQQIAMRARCRALASEAFDFRVFVEPLSEFFQFPNV